MKTPDPDSSSLTVADVWFVVLHAQFLRGSPQQRAADRRQGRDPSRFEREASRLVVAKAQQISPGSDPHSATDIVIGWAKNLGPDGGSTAEERLYVEAADRFAQIVKTAMIWTWMDVGRSAEEAAHWLIEAAQHGA
jgi:hypothetical protein